MKREGLKLCTFDYWWARLRKTVADEVSVVEVVGVVRPTSVITAPLGERVVIELDGVPTKSNWRKH